MIENAIIFGDNIDVLSSFDDGCIDLCYVDPPYNTGETRETVVRGKVIRFDDSWDDLASYVGWMRKRIVEIHRVLKETGSFYLHVDHHSDAYLRVTCDQVFGEKNLRACISWKRCVAKGKANLMGNVLDTIFLYTKSDKFIYHRQYRENLTDRQLRDYKKDVNGKLYKLDDLTAPGTANRFEWRGVTPKARSWRYTREKLEEMFNAGLIKKGLDGKPLQAGLIKYVDSIPCKQIDNLWDDIKPLTNAGDERVDYPTQKPESLLERVILSSSDEGCIVLDPCCGSGTTCVVAKKLGRRYIGIDISEDACTIALKRLEKINVVEL